MCGAAPHSRLLAAFLLHERRALDSMHLPRGLCREPPSLPTPAMCIAQPPPLCVSVGGASLLFVDPPRIPLHRSCICVAAPPYLDALWGPRALPAPLSNLSRFMLSWIALHWPELTAGRRCCPPPLPPNPRHGGGSAGASLRPSSDRPAADWKRSVTLSITVERSARAGRCWPGMLAGHLGGGQMARAGQLAAWPTPLMSAPGPFGSIHRSLKHSKSLASNPAFPLRSATRR